MTVNRIEEWTERWDNEHISFHKSDVNPGLAKWYTRLFPNGEPSRVVVPLCGKTVDMMWLYKKGHTVIGIEGVEKAILDFFSENKLEFQKSSSGKQNMFQTIDGRLQIYHGDICHMSPSVFPPVQAVWDRGSYVAINYEDRPKYAQFIQGVLAPEYRYLLEAVEYNKDLYSGPPRCLTHDNISTEFGTGSNIECLSQVSYTPDDKPKLRHWNLDKLVENIYMLTPRQ